MEYGPAPLLARFVLEGDKAAQQLGIRLRLRHDFETAIYEQAKIQIEHSFPLIKCSIPIHGADAGNACRFQRMNDARRYHDSRRGAVFRLGPRRGLKQEAAGGAGRQAR